MKKIILIFALCMLFMLSLSLSAAAESMSLVDEADILTQSEEEELTAQLEAVKNKYKVDVAVVTVKEMPGATAEASADDRYDYYGYGLGEDHSGILLYLCLNPREYHFTTHAYGREVFNDNGLRYLSEQVLPYLKNDDYGGAFKAYAAAADELLKMAAEGKPYNAKPDKNVVLPIAAALAVSFIAAFALTYIKLGQMKTALEQTEANNYMQPGSLKLAVSEDIFLYSHVDKREKVKDNASDSSHTSSSGKTHGGRGGSF